MFPYDLYLLIFISCNPLFSLWHNIQVSVTASHRSANLCHFLYYHKISASSIQNMFLSHYYLIFCYCSHLLFCCAGKWFSSEHTLFAKPKLKMSLRSLQNKFFFYNLLDFSWIYWMRFCFKCSDKIYRWNDSILTVQF